MAGFTRRQLLLGSTAGLLAASTRKAWAQTKPDKLVLVCENSIPWKRTLLYEVAPAFEKANGIKVEASTSRCCQFRWENGWRLIFSTITK